jgi:zinc protease
MKRASQKPPRVFSASSHDLPIVDLYLVTETGTAHDPRGREGALHLCLRALRRGTARRTAHEIDALIDRLGAELSTSADPTTSMLHATVIRRNLEPFLDLMHDIVTAPALPTHEVAQVAREIKAEIIDTRDDDRSLAGRHFRRALFDGHVFGRASQGTPNSMDRLTRDDARRAWDLAFRRSNVVIAAAGDIRPAELETFAARTLAALPDTRPPARDVAEPAPVKGRHLVIVDKPARTQTQIYVGNVGSHPRDRDHMALTVANTIFGGTFTARLMREIRSKRGWSYGASSRLARDRVRDAWSMWTFPAAADAPACVALQIKMVERLVEKGVSARELAFAKSYLSRSFAFEIDTASKRLWHDLDVRLLDLPKRYFKDYVARVDAVTLDEVNAAIRKRIDPDNLVITLVATASEIRPALEKCLKGLDSTRVVSFDVD